MIEDAHAQQPLHAGVDVFRDLPPSEVEYLATRCPIVHLGQKEGLAPLEERRGVLLLLGGRVRVHEQAFGTHGLTFSVAEGATLVVQTGPERRSSRALRVEALEPSILSVVGWEDFEELVSRNPEVGLRTIRLLGERLEAYEGRLSDLVRKEVPARLAGLLLGLSEREGSLDQGERRIPARYTHKQLASMVGSNREAVTRAMAKMRRAGAVRTRDRTIYVTDEDALWRLDEAVR
jgi:CRP/FNR family cyclic AMP-dependent transcriptional regulator